MAPILENGTVPSKRVPKRPREYLTPGEVKTVAKVSGRLLFCLPAGGILGGQIVAIFVRWADQHPERWQLAPSDAALAFREAFPCKP